MFDLRNCEMSVAKISIVHRLMMNERDLMQLAARHDIQTEKTLLRIRFYHDFQAPLTMLHPAGVSSALGRLIWGPFGLRRHESGVQLGTRPE